jgi:hypothetical protein
MINRRRMPIVPCSTITGRSAKEKVLQVKPGVVTDLDLDDRDYSKGWGYGFEVAHAIGWNRTSMLMQKPARLAI